MKTLDIEERKEIAALDTPGRAKRAGRKVHLRADWEEIKENVMLELKEKLLATGAQCLVEGNTWHDNIWGSCSCDKCQRQGQNKLGQILMRVREQMRYE